MHIDSTLSWSTHIEHIIKKATTRLYFLKQLKRPGLPKSHLLHFYITVVRPVLEYCAPVWHYALTKAQSESLEAVQKRAIHITHNLTRGMPYSSMLLHVNLIRWLHVEKISLSVFSVILWILHHVSTASFLHPDPPLSPLGSDLHKSFLQSILVSSAIVPSYNMDLPLPVNLLSTMTSIRLFVLGACLCTMLASLFFLQSCFVFLCFFRVFKMFRVGSATVVRLCFMSDIVLLID